MRVAVRLLQRLLYGLLQGLRGYYGVTMYPISCLQTRVFSTTEDALHKSSRSLRPAAAGLPGKHSPPGAWHELNPGALSSWGFKVYSLRSFCPCLRKAARQICCSQHTANQMPAVLGPSAPATTQKAATATKVAGLTTPQLNKSQAQVKRFEVLPPGYQHLSMVYQRSNDKTTMHPTPKP